MKVEFPEILRREALTASEQAALLEIAYLAAASSGDLSDSECVAFVRLAEGERDPSVKAAKTAVDTSPSALFRRFDAYDREIARAGRAVRLGALGQAATRDVVRTAFYDAAEWVTWADGNQCDAEREFLAELRAALAV